MIEFSQEVCGVYSGDPTTSTEVLHGYFLHEDNANTVATHLRNTTGVQHIDVRIETVSITVFESVAEYQDHYKQQLREKALSKLTVEEQEVLGLIPAPAPARKAAQPKADQLPTARDRFVQQQRR